MRITIDANVLFYSIDGEAADKQAIARDILARAPLADAVLTAQALGEFLNAVRRRFPALFPEARVQADWLAGLMPIVATTGEHVRAAAAFAEAHRLQFWDSVIWQVARSAGAVFLLSEDMQDGLSLDGLTVLNPFNPANADRLENLLAPKAGLE